MKKTLVSTFFDYFAPHYCYFCGRIGSLYCEECQKLEKSQGFYIKNSKTVFNFEFYIAQRDGILRQIVDDYKFNNIKQNKNVLAEILAKSFIPHMKKGEKYVVVPIPTARRNIRERGFDHIKLLTKEFCAITGLDSAEVLDRAANSRQRGANAKKRREQASKAFLANQPIDKNVHYIILDDIKTTGSTLEEAAKLLRKNGATKISAIYFLKQE